MPTPTGQPDETPDEVSPLEIQKLARHLLLISLEERKLDELQLSAEVLKGISAQLLEDITEEQGMLLLQIKSNFVEQGMTAKQVGLYCDDFLALQIKTWTHKTTMQYKKHTGIPDGEEVPGVLLLNTLDQIEHHIRTGIDKVKLDMLLEMTLSEGSLSKKEKMESDASIKRAYEYTLGFIDFVEMKAAKHMTVILQMLLLSNVPCSHRHYSTIVEITTRLLSSQAMSGIRDECLMQLSELKEFSTLLVEETLNDVRTQAQQTMSP